MSDGGMSTTVTGWWNKFHAWVTKNPGFYAGIAIGALAGHFLL